MDWTGHEFAVFFRARYPIVYSFLDFWFRKVLGCLLGWGGGHDGKKPQNLHLRAFSSSSFFLLGAKIMLYHL